MVVVYVKHYLTLDGLLYFPMWFQNISSVLKKQNGFMSIGYGEDRTDKSCVNLVLKFENEEKLTAWGRSDLHNVEVGKLDPYRIKPYDATRINLIRFITSDES